MARKPAERNTVGNTWSIFNDPKFDDHIGRATRRQAQSVDAFAIAQSSPSPKYRVRKLYGEWCVIGRLGSLMLTADNWKTAMFYARLYAVT